MALALSSSSFVGSPETATMNHVLAEHMQGKCNPCVFFFSSYGCARGNACRYCHWAHEEEDCGSRPRKTRRYRTRVWVEDDRGKFFECYCYWYGMVRLNGRWLVMKYQPDSALPCLLLPSCATIVMEPIDHVWISSPS